MPMPRMRVTNTHGLEIDEIAKLAAHVEKPEAIYASNAHRGGHDASGYTCGNHSPDARMFARLCLAMRRPVEQAGHGGRNESQRRQPELVHRGCFKT